MSSDKKKKRDLNSPQNKLRRAELLVLQQQAYDKTQDPKRDKFNWVADYFQKLHKPTVTEENFGSLTLDKIKEGVIVTSNAKNPLIYASVVTLDNLITYVGDDIASKIASPLQDLALEIAESSKLEDLVDLIKKDETKALTLKTFNRLTQSEIDVFSGIF